MKVLVETSARHVHLSQERKKVFKYKLTSTGKKL